jgi:hypothetical protein
MNDEFGEKWEESCVAFFQGTILAVACLNWGTNEEP